MTNWEELSKREELDEVAKKRSIETIQEKFEASQIESKLACGWSLVKNYKNGSALMETPKEIGDSFEDNVWMIFYKMGFKILNRSNKFRLSYSINDPNLTKQIDVVAIDDEVCLLVECKSTNTLDNTKTWKTDLESIKGNIGGLFNEISKNYPNRKCKYIFATNNYIIGQQDIDRMRDFRIGNFDSDVIRYYKELVTHLGSAARYQLLGNIFSKQKIKEMDTNVPAIQGKMGGEIYYSFSIEPERLLKISYVLHRLNANHDLMPTYQRLIKKDRLNKIRDFINNNGYFPNSIIISIDTNGKGLQFDLSSLNPKDSLSKIGILHLPQNYQSAYVIDGQHRLYGYSDSKYSENNTIPVVAFVDLDKKVQEKMFMDINENQKAVPKSLRNTLDIDLLWDSEVLSERRLSLLLYISQKLGEDKSSPLYGRIVTGENTQTADRCITIEYIKEALNKSNFFNTYKKNNQIVNRGVFENYGAQDNEKTSKIFFPFLLKVLNLIRDFNDEEWAKGSNGYLTINNMIYAIIAVINDIVNIVVEKEKINVVNDSDLLYKKCEDYFLNLSDTISKLDPAIQKEIKEAKGGAAKNISWHKLQVAMHNFYPSFTNREIEIWVEEHENNNNPQGDYYIDEIERYIVEKTKNKLKDLDTWIIDCVPQEKGDMIIGRSAIENQKRKYKGEDETTTPWDFVDLDVIYSMVSYKNNWTAYFQTILVPNGMKNTKNEVLMWLKSLINYKNIISIQKQITKTQFEEIEGIYKMFFGDEQ